MMASSKTTGASAPHAIWVAIAHLLLIWSSVGNVTEFLASIRRIEEAIRLSFFAIPSRRDQNVIKLHKAAAA